MTAVANRKQPTRPTSRRRPPARRPRPHGGTGAAGPASVAGLLAPAAAALSLGLDRQRGTAWLVDQANRYRIDHVRHGGSVYFTAEDLGSSLAWLWYMSDHVGPAKRHWLRAEAIDRRVAAIDVAIAEVPPSLRVGKAMEYRGHQLAVDQFVRTVDVDQASALGCDLGATSWPVEIRMGQVDFSVAMSLWYGMAEAARRRAARLLSGEEAKGAGRAKR